MQPASPTPPAARPRASTSLVIGVAALAVLTLILLVAVVLQRDGGTSGGRPSPSGTASPSVTTAASATTPGGAPTAGTTAAPNGELAQDDLVQTTVEGLTVRGDPGTAGEELGSLAEGAVSFLMMGPVQPGLDGYDWYLVTGRGLPPATGCTDPIKTDPYDCPVWLGYVAGADTDGTPWLVSFDAGCTDPPPEDLQTLTLGHPALELLHCYGDAELVFRAWWPGETDPPACDATDGPLWLRCPTLTLGWGQDYPEAIAAAADPAADFALPDGGQWVEVTARHDHVESARCAQPADATAEELRVILGCRATLVVSGMEPAPAP